MCLPGEAWYLHALAAIRTVAAPSAALIEQSLPLGDERRSREVKRRINLLSRSDHGQAQAEQQADYPQRITSIWRREHLQRVDAAGHNQLQFYLNPGPYQGRQNPTRSTAMRSARHARRLIPPWVRSLSMDTT